jgi:hypothetical protein
MARGHEVNFLQLQRPEKDSWWLNVTREQLFESERIWIGGKYSKIETLVRV